MLWIVIYINLKREDGLNEITYMVFRWWKEYNPITKEFITMVSGHSVIKREKV